MRSILAKLLLVFFAIFIVLGILEITARLINATIFKDKLTAADLKTKFEHTFIPPFPSKKPAALRVFVYGGSTVQGLPLPKVGFVAQLDDQLHHIFGSEHLVEVYNLGWSGYNSTMVRYMVERTISDQPDVLIIDTGSNEFIYPQLDAYVPLRLLTILKNRSALVKLFLALKTAPERTPDQEEPLDYKRSPYRLEPIFFNLKMWLFRRNLQAITALARSHHIPVIFTTPVSNLADWPPVDVKVTTLSTNSANRAAEFYSQAEIATQAGDFIKAQELFIKAKDWDLIPWRSTTDQNNFIRSLADSHIVWVADTEAAFLDQAPNHLPGFALVLDNVHPSPQGSFLMARTIINLLLQNKIIKPDWWAGAKSPSSLDQFLAQIKFSPTDKFKIYFSTARYSLKNPFFHLDIARNYLDQAQALEFSDWRLPALKGTLAFLNGDLIAAHSFFNQARTYRSFPLIYALINQEIPYINYFWTPAK